MSDVVAYVREKQLPKKLATTFQQHRKLSVWWILCNLGGGLSPIWLAVFFRHAYGHNANLFDFVMRGDLALLSAAFLSPAIFQVLMLFKRERTTLGIGAVVLAGIGSVISAVLYSTTNPETLSQELSSSINRFFVGSWSFGLLIFSVAFAFLTFLNDRQLEAADYDAIEANDQAALRARVLSRNPETTVSEFSDTALNNQEKGHETPTSSDQAQVEEKRARYSLATLFTEPAETDESSDDDQ